MNSLTEENYLKALFHLSKEKGEVSASELSSFLGTKMPTVNSMMRKLAEKDLVCYEKYKPLRLTKKGLREAALIIRKHRLTEMFLVEKMGFSWDKVHEIAEQVEHVQSPEFFEKTDALLMYPKIDPHGSPIPDKNGEIEYSGYKKLSDCKIGDSVVFCAIDLATPQFYSFLDKKNLKIGSTIKILSIEEFDGSTLIEQSDSTSTTLSRTVCDKILVKF